jgi:hypothetical protein
MKAPKWERQEIKILVDRFLELLGLSGKFTIRYTKHKMWSLRFQEFDGSSGQQLLLNAHLAVKLSNKGIHGVVVHRG